MKAEASPKSRLTEPGPQEEKVATGRWATRNKASAMKAAAASWWTDITLIRSR